MAVLLALAVFFTFFYIIIYQAP